MLTDDDIRGLLELPKEITAKAPANGYVSVSGSKRCELRLQGIGENPHRFRVFVRQNETFIEGYSIGLRYRTADRAIGTITLVRYNGPHGESGMHGRGDGHYARPHIHRITAEELASGSIQPQEKHREITDRYDTFEEAMRVFFEDMNIGNWRGYFMELQQAVLFDEHQ